MPNEQFCIKYRHGLDTTPRQFDCDAVIIVNRDVLDLQIEENISLNEQ